MSSEQEDNPVELLREAWKWARAAKINIKQSQTVPDEVVRAAVLSMALRNVEDCMKAIKAAGKKLKE